jgi:hypothetical protein
MAMSSKKTNTSKPAPARERWGGFCFISISIRICWGRRGGSRRGGGPGGGGGSPTAGFNIQS